MQTRTGFSATATLSVAVMVVLSGCASQRISSALVRIGIKCAVLPVGAAFGTGIG